MPNKPEFISKEKLAEYEVELEHMRTVRLQEVAQRIHAAMELANADHNAEYDDAKNDLAFVKGHIMELENVIKNAVVIDPATCSKDKVGVGCTVTVVRPDGCERRYYIVGSAEANPKDGKISHESPVGRALLGRTVGEEVSVLAPSGLQQLTIKEIS